MPHLLLGVTKIPLNSSSRDASILIQKPTKKPSNPMEMISTMAVRKKLSLFKWIVLYRPLTHGSELRELEESP